MKNIIKKTVALISIASLICLNACSDKNPADESTTLSPGTQTTEAVTEAESLARVVEVPYLPGVSAVFTFNEKGLLISSENCPDGDDNDYYKYDEQNRIIEIQHTLYDGTIDSNCERVSYIYDENGRLSKKNIYHGAADELTRSRTTEYVYNEQGLLIEKHNLTGITKEVLSSEYYEYDENQNVIKLTHRGINNIDYTLYEYDENGNCTLMNWVDHELNSHVTEYFYNENGLLVSQAGETDTFNYEYDDNGHLISETSDDYTVNYEYNEDGLMTKGTTTYGIVTYEYYDNNNVVAVFMTEETEINAIPEVMGNYSEIISM